MGSKSRYSPEFQAAAVRLLAEPGATNESVGRDLGLSRETIRLWARRMAAEDDPAVCRARQEHAELVALRRRVRVLEEEREELGKSSGLPRRGEGPDVLSAYQLIGREKAGLHLSTMCRVLGVSRSGYLAWARGPARARAAADAELLGAIRAVHAASRGTYGAPRVHAVLRAEGRRVGRKRVARLMREARIVGVHRRRWLVPTPRPPARAATAPDLVRRDFRAAAPDRLWVADITYLPTAAGFLYLAVILDTCSRRVVGWSMADHQRTELVLDALEAAIAARHPRPGLVHHSDRGTQYTSLALGARLAEAGIAASMGAPGSAYDNAMAESFFASLETELIDRSGWLGHAQARLAVFDWIERFYNRQRIHSAIGYLSPDEFERRYRSGTSFA